MHIHCRCSHCARATFIRLEQGADGSTSYATISDTLAPLGAIPQASREYYELYTQILQDMSNFHGCGACHEGPVTVSVVGDN